MAHVDAREGKWRGNWRMEWVSSTLHTTSEHCVSSITTADAHTSAASSRLNWRPRQFKWIRTFRRKTKSGFCACAITFQLACTCCPHNRSVPAATEVWGLWFLRGGRARSDEEPLPSELGSVMKQLKLGGRVTDGCDALRIVIHETCPYSMGRAKLIPL